MGMQRVRGILVALWGGCLITFWQAPVQAAMYASDVAFETTDQSMWAPGAAGILDINHFIGPQWNESGSIGGIAEVTTPSITLIPEVCLWGVCTPAVTIPSADLGDYGAEITGQTDGQIGFDLALAADSGSVNVAYPVGTTFEWPDPQDLSAGAPLLLSTSLAEGATAMSTNFPEASLTLDFVFDVHAEGGFEVCVAFCGALDFPTIDINETINLVDIDSNTTAITFDIGPITTTAQIPDLDTSTTGTNASGDLVSSGIGSDPLLDVDVDLDLIATTLLGLPPLGAEIGIFGASAGYELLDVLVGANVQVVQSFTFDPTLMVQLDLSDGQSKTVAVGDSVLFDTPVAKETTVTPTFFLDNTFTNTTSLRIDPTFDLEILSAHLGLDLPGIVNALGVPDININLGPLFEQHLTTPGPDIAVFDQSWALPFDQVMAANFTIRTPEPGALILLGTGLLGVAVSRRRRRIPA